LKFLEPSGDGWYKAVIRGEPMFEGQEPAGGKGEIGGNAPAGSEEVFGTKNLTRRFGEKVAVDGISLCVGAGEFFGFVGPNGAGKTTTLRMVTGLLRPTAGAVRVFGMDPFRQPMEVKSRIGVVPDEPPLYDRLTGRESIEFAGRLHLLDPSQAKSRSEELLEWLDLAEAASSQVGEYSLGMKKKVAIACALVHRPRLLFMDEPFSGIDPIGVRRIKDTLSQLVEEGGTVFFSSHVMELVERICTRVAIIHNGKIRGLGTLEELRAAAGLPGEATMEDAFVALVGEGASGEVVCAGS
jgi:ABC-2 type transport system ATP-binding protein